MVKKVLLIAVVLMLAALPLRAQTLYDLYLFSTWVDANAWITLDSTADTMIDPPLNPNYIRNSFRSTVTSIGFPFTLAGVDHTQFSVNVYGTLRLGSIPVLESNSGTKPLYMVGQNMPKIEPFGGRMCVDYSSSVRRAIIGDSGSRVLVVEMRLATYNTPRATLSAQVQLFEATGEVRIVYGSSVGDTLPMAIQNGIAASESDVVFIDMVADEAVFSEGGVSQTNPAGMWPEEGRVYSFTFNPDYCPRPGAVSMTNSNPDSLTLEWSGSGSQYHLFVPDAGIDTLVTATTITLSGLYDTTTYSGTLQTVCSNDTSHSVSFSFSTAISPAHTPLFSCDFEVSDAMNVWEQRWVTFGGGSWSRVSDNTRPIGNRWTVRCHSGSDNRTNTWLITPNITLPADANGYYLRWKQRVYDEWHSNPIFEVRLAAAADTIADGAPTSAYSTILYTKTGVTSGYQSHQMSLAQYGGQTIRIAFVDNALFGRCSMFIDDIEVVPTYRPEITLLVPDSVEVGDTMQLTATVRQGYTTGMTVEWHSAMEARGEAFLTYDSLQATIVYYTEGIDTITVTAIGQYGNGSSAATIWVPDPLRFVVPHTALAADATLAAVLDTIGFKVTLTGGSTIGLQHTWWSAMASRGEALLNTTASDDSVRLVYLTSGLDTVVVHTDNVYGQSNDTVMLTVCPVQDTLPWVADFGNDFPCWQVLKGTCEVNSYGHLSFTDWPTAVVSPLIYVPADGDVVLEYNCSYLFFYGSTLVMVTTDMINYDTIEDHPFTTGTHPSVRLSLNTYAGQYIRVAFKTIGQPLQYYLTKVIIRYCMKPVVTLAADDGYFPGSSVVLTATLQEGDTTSLTYTWHSILLDSTVTLNSNLLSLNYTQSGTDTITVIATNAYGSDTAMVVFDALVITQPEVTLQHTEANVNEPTVFTAVLNRCVAEGLTYTWHSARLGDLNEFSRFDGFNGRCEVTYSAGGLDTVTVIASTLYGADTASVVVEVFSITLPWTENFNTTMAVNYNSWNGMLPKCWRGYWNGTNGNLKPQVIYDYIQNTNIRSYVRNNHALLLQAGTDAGYNSISLVVTPAFDVPLAGKQLSFYYMFEQAEHGQLLVGYMQNEGFVSLAEIEPQATGRTEYVILNGMPADANRIAFQWKYAGSLWYGVILDDVSVGERVPIIRFVSNNLIGYVADTTTITAQLVNELTDSLSYSWHSSLMDTTIVTLGPVLPIVYDTEGNDTLTLVATNAYGSDTATAEVSVINHPLPQVTLSDPSETLVGDTVGLVATLNNCSLTALTCTLYSSLLDTTLTATSHHSPFTFYLSYPAGGIDTLTVIASNAYGTDTALAFLRVINIDCGNVAVPYGMDFESVTATNFNVAGHLPLCWESSWNGSYDAYTPHVISSNGYPFFYLSDLPNNALLMVAGNVSIFGNLAETRLPRFSDSLQHLALAFDYRFESISYGVLSVGYYDTTNNFVAVKILQPYTGSYHRDTAVFSSATLPDAQMVLRWTIGSSWYVVAIDNIAVFNADSLPMAPLVAINGPTTAGNYDTVTFTAQLLRGDTTGLAYTWHSTLLDSVMVGPSVQLFYDTIGVDTLSVTATTAIGVNTAMLIVSVDTLSVPDTLWRTVTVTANEEGVCESYGSGVYPDSSTVEIGYTMVDTVTVGGHWRFLGWSDGGTGNPRDILVTSDTAIVTLFEWIEDSVGIGEVEKSKREVEIFPNPASSDVTVKVSRPSILTVIDLQGRMVIPPTPVNSQFLILKSQLTFGTYFVRVTTQESVTIKKLIMQ